MKKIKLLIVGIFTLMLGGSYSFGASLSITPYTGSIGKNCIQEFLMILGMDDGDKSIALEAVLQSNMTFIGFENADLFEYSLPYYIAEDGVHIRLINSHGGEISRGGVIGKVYFKAISGEKPYLNYVFSGGNEGSMVLIGGTNILKGVKGGTFLLNTSSLCEDDLEREHNLSYNPTIDEFVDNYLVNEEGKEQQLLKKQNLLYIIGGSLISLLIIIFMIFVINRKGKK